MIVLFALFVVLVALLQVLLSTFTVAGVMPLIGLLVVVWISYRYDAILALPLLLFVGLILSFFTMTPALTILAYGLAGVLVVAGISLTSDEYGMSTYGSILMISAAALVILLVNDIDVISSQKFLPMLTYLLIATAATAFVWFLMMMIASPRR